MNILELKEILKEKRGYLKSGPSKLSVLFGISKRKAKQALQEVKQELYGHVRAPQDVQNKKFKRMFFDIETSYNIVNSWRIGYNLVIHPEDIKKERAIICVCWKWEGEDTVHSLTWDHNQDDKQLLELFTEEMLLADEVIGHNGDRFDIPWLRTRAVIHNVSFPAYIKSFDTLIKARRGGFNFNSNKLDYLSKLLLGEGKMETGGKKLWDDIIERKDPVAMKKMVEYCKVDVKRLEEVFNRLKTYTKPNTHVGVHIGNGKDCCSHCGSTDANYIKVTVTAAGTPQHLFQCNSCSAYYKLSDTSYKKLKVNGNL